MGRWWAVDIPAVAVQTQCRTLDEAEDMARDAIGGAFGVPPETIAVDLVVPEVAPLLEGVLQARQRRAAAAAAEQQTLAEAAQALAENLGVSPSDTCRLLGISQQEVSELAPPRNSGDLGARPFEPLAGRSGQSRGIRGSGDAVRPAAGHPPPRPEFGGGSAIRGYAIRSNRHIPASSTRPSWAIAEDEG